jgi:hypothetical protein
LSFAESAEFYLFMDMRAELGWVSFNMTSRGWVTATREYNLRLAALSGNQNSATVLVKKNPRVLLKMLNQVETRISERIQKGDYMCKYLMAY